MAPLTLMASYSFLRRRVLWISLCPSPLHQNPKSMDGHLLQLVIAHLSIAYHRIYFQHNTTTSLTIARQRLFLSNNLQRQWVTLANCIGTPWKQASGHLVKQILLAWQSQTTRQGQLFPLFNHRFQLTIFPL